MGAISLMSGPRPTAVTNTAENTAYSERAAGLIKPMQGLQGKNKNAQRCAEEARLPSSLATDDLDYFLELQQARSPQTTAADSQWKPAARHKRRSSVVVRTQRAARSSSC